MYKCTYYNTFNYIYPNTTVHILFQLINHNTLFILYLHNNIHTHTHTYTHPPTHTHIFIYVYICMYYTTYVYKYIYIHICNTWL